MTREEIIRDLKELAQCYAELHRENSEICNIEIRWMGLMPSITGIIYGVLTVGNPGSFLLPLLALAILLWVWRRERYWNRELCKCLKLRQECLEVIDRI